MRSKQEIEKSIVESVDFNSTTIHGMNGIKRIGQVQLEVLLDIRDLLTKMANPLFQVKDGKITPVSTNPQTTL